MDRSGAEILIEALVREGVEVLFGYPGGSVLPIYDALYDSPLLHVLTRHEQGAAHAADGYARATGRTGVCLATSGPGATNLVTGIATAYMDSVPMVALTGQVPRGALGRDSFQEADITGITLPITKHNFLVNDIADIPRVIREAFHIASTGRPGPVLVDLPKDILMARATPQWPDAPAIVGYKPSFEGHPRQVEAALRALLRAQRPVLYVGGGVVTSGGDAEVTRLAEGLGIPVVSTLMGIGGFPGDHPLYLGMVGMHGTHAANHAVSECDLLVAIGARFDDRVTANVKTFATGAKVIHIDIDPAEIGKNVRAHIPIVGDVKAVLGALLAALGELSETGAEAHGPPRAAWLHRVQAWQAEQPLTYDMEGELKPQYVIQELCRATGGRGVIVTDVGQHQMWSAHYCRRLSPRSFLSSGGLGTMGFGLPAAIGAQMGRPGEPVIAIVGDGGFQMNIQELATAASYGVPVKVAIMNNGYLGMVRQWQDIFYNRRYSHVALMGNPDFVKVAEAYGILAIRVDTAEQVPVAIREAMAHDGPVVLDFHIAPEENVFPMVPPNGTINQMMAARPS